MCSDPSGEPADKVSRSEASGQVNALAPRAHIAEEREQDSFTADCCEVILGGVMVAHQNPMTSRLRWFACSIPRRLSRRRSA